MYKLVLCFVMMLSLTGCEVHEQLTIDNQIKNQIEYKKVFLNSTHSITVLVVEQKQPEILAIKNIVSVNKIKFITNSDKNIITWNTYAEGVDPEIKSRLGPWDVVVHLTNTNDIEAGEFNKGKSGTEKLYEL